MEVKIEWGEPYKVKVGTVNHWRRTWFIPQEARNSFFQFWREEKFRWLTEGFRVYKEDDEWYLSETQISPIQFKAIGVTKKGPPPVSDFILPDYNILDESGLRPWQVVAAGRLVSSIKEWGAAIDGSDCGCHPKGTYVRMFNGDLVKVEDVVVGDKLMGDDSTPRTVLSLLQGHGDLFIIHPYSGGEPFGVNGDHVLVLTNTRSKEKIEISVRDYIFKCTSSMRFHSEHKLFRAGVEYKKQDVPLDPYFLGLWIGDGTWCRPEIAVADIDVEIAGFLEQFAKTIGVRLVIGNPKKRIDGTVAKCRSYSLRGYEQGYNPLLSLMRSMGIITKEKFIPKLYSINDRETRLKLLAGIVDSDGSFYNNGGYEVSCKHDSLNESIVELARSLGYCVNSRKVDRTWSYKGKKYTNKYWRISISGANDLPCKLRRKFSSPRLQPKNVLHTSFGVQPIGMGDYYGFSLDSNCRYLLKDFTVTHNTGKSFCSCAVVRELGMNMVVVCPKSGISTWNLIIKDHFKMGNKLIDVINYEQLRIGKSTSKVASFVLPRGSKRKQFQWKVNKNNTLIVWDESQKLKNWKTKTAKTCVAAYQQGFKQLFLSATNATTPLELRAVGMSLKLFRGGQQNWYQWIKEHGCNKGMWGGMEFTENIKLRQKILKKLHKEIFLDRGVRLRRDSIPNFPECDLFAVLLDMEKEDTNKINSIYDEMERELKQLEKLQKLNRHNHLVVELRFRQRAELTKVPLFIDMIEEAKEEGFSIAVFVNFTDTINAISKRTGIKCIFDGKVGDKVRELNKLRFQDNEEPVILVSVQAGGGVLSLHDLHGGHPRLSVISPSHSIVDMRQVVGRIWRDDAKTKAVQKLVCVANTVEEKVYHNIIKKSNNLDILNDGDLNLSKQYTTIKD